jgi:ribosomal protein S12 methylthiotransferase accessory factor
MSSLESLETLVSPLGGLIGRVVRIPTIAGEPTFINYSGELGDLTKVLPNVRASTNNLSTTGEIDGAGGGLDEESALTKALAETLERYCSCVYSREQFIWATAEELGNEALDLDLIPRCSEREASHPSCPLVMPDKTAPMRWVRGVSLHRRTFFWIPVAMVYLHIPWLSIGERCVLPISTGCAAHPQIEQALVNALCEVIERDSIALTWLQQLALPQLEIDAPGDALPFWEACRNSQVRTYFFDATTELGIPTVYSVDVAPHNEKLATVVMCATDLNPARALAKVIRESSSSRVALQAPHDVPASPDAFIKVFHGAKYMAARQRQHAFDFLLHSPTRRQFSGMPNLDTGGEAANLVFLLRRLEECGMEAFAVDLTTDEAVRSNMRVVRVLIPRLQPLTFSFRARYLGHPRLYEAPGRMGFPIRAEEEINPWPQPFA